MFAAVVQVKGGGAMNTKYFRVEGGHVARYTVGGESLSGAEVLRDGKWVPTTPAELAWNANPISEERALKQIEEEMKDTARC